MKKVSSTIFGSSLLEVMLVLVIVSLVMLLSIRYYQNSQTSSMTTNTLAKIQAITAAAEDLTTGSTNGYNDFTTAALTSVLGSKLLTTDWGSSIKISTTTPVTYSTYTVELADSTNKMPYSVCIVLKQKIPTNVRYTVSASCVSGGVSPFTYTYTDSGAV